ncbi:MAG: 1-acyl-sn-glycerol-3-phosphate acyltransferase [Gammaproteobacteria bacterium]|nr:1-acyl-sn-glycerol-3-phosphate acyltransferase [Gammaproteobacteria bacterium]
MKSWRALWRLTWLGVWLTVGVILALFRLRVHPNSAYTNAQQRLVVWWSRQLLSVIGVQLCHQGQPIPGSVWVANHHSWLDILVVMAVSPARFLSKHEVAHWPVIGWLAQRAGTVFLKRGQGETSQAMQHMANLVRAGDSVLFFPEGTTTDHAPKSFHARLFALPIELGVSVQPLCLSYHDAQDRRTDIAYVGEQSFIANLWYLLQQDCLQAHIHFLSALTVTADTSRNVLAQQTHTAVEQEWLKLAH